MVVRGGEDLACRASSLPRHAHNAIRRVKMKRNILYLTIIVAVLGFKGLTSALAASDSSSQDQFADIANMAGQRAQEAIDHADSMLAGSGCNEESTSQECKDSLRDMALARIEMAGAQTELSRTKKDGTAEPRYDRAIEHYKKAYELAQRAAGIEPENEQ